MQKRVLDAAILYLNLCIYWLIDGYELFLKFLLDFTDDNIWLTAQNLKDQNSELFKKSFSF